MKNQKQEETLKSKSNRNFQAWGFDHLLSIFVEVFLKPFYRIAKHGISLKSDMPISNLVYDIGAMCFIFAMMGVFGFYKGMIVIGSYFAFCYFIGHARRYMAREKVDGKRGFAFKFMPNRSENYNPNQADIVVEDEFKPRKEEPKSKEIFNKVEEKYYKVSDVVMPKEATRKLKKSE